jgi:tRNA pseudouridine55 synthase
MDLIINLNKPEGISSHKTVAKVKKIFKAKKAGHAGTLDPAVTGVLLICINKATRIASYFTSLNKVYTAVMKLGETTDTQDAEGTVMAKNDYSGVDKELIRTTIKSFEGELLQTPPMYSALKYKGKPLYIYAKKGLNVPVKPRTIHVLDIEILDITLPFVSFSVTCSRGTYIRTLCHDIGEKLGVGAHLFELKRTAVGSFYINKSLSIDTLNLVNQQIELSQSNVLPKGIYTMDHALGWLPELKITKQLIKSVKNGMALNMSTFHNLSENLKTASGIRIKSPGGDLMAVGSFLSGKNVVKMDVVFPT